MVPPLFWPSRKRPWRPPWKRQGRLKQKPRLLRPRSNTACNAVVSFVPLGTPWDPLLGGVQGLKDIPGLPRGPVVQTVPRRASAGQTLALGVRAGALLQPHPPRQGRQGHRAVGRAAADTHVGQTRPRDGQHLPPGGMASARSRDLASLANHAHAHTHTHTCFLITEARGRAPCPSTIKRGYCTPIGFWGLHYGFC